MTSYQKLASPHHDPEGEGVHRHGQLAAHLEQLGSQVSDGSGARPEAEGRMKGGE